MNREEEWIRSIIDDNLEAFKVASERFDKFTTFKNTKTKVSKETILHVICTYGAEKIFDWFYPQVSKIRLNMFDKYKRTPFYNAVTGPSEKIFKTMLNDDNVYPKKWDDKEQYGSTQHLGYPIMQCINKKEFADRVTLYFDTKSDYQLNWGTWYVYSMWQNQEWALDLVLKNGEYNKLESYQKRGGVRKALDFNRLNMAKKVYDYDNTVFFTESGGGTSPLGAAMKKGTLKEVMEWIPTLSTSPKEMDSTVEEALRYDSPTNREYMEILQTKNIKISDELIKKLTTGYLGDVFFETAVNRDDYESRIQPFIIDNLELWERFAPSSVKDIFMF